MNSCPKNGLAACLFFASRAVGAQTWVDESACMVRACEKLAGIPTEIGFGMEAGIDSNVFYETARRDGDTLLVITPHVAFGTGSASAVQGENGTAFDLAGVLAPVFYRYGEHSALNDQGVLAVLRANLEAGASARLFARGELNRFVMPFVFLPGSSVDDWARYATTATVGLDLTTRNRIFGLLLSYRNDLLDFDDSVLAIGNTVSHRGELDVRWYFAPRTKLVSRFGYARRTMTASPKEGWSVSVDGDEMTAEIGLEGAITRSVAAVVSAGNGSGWFDEGDDYDGPVLNFVVRTALARNVTLDTGIHYTFEPSLYGNFMRRAVARVQTEVIVGGLTLHASTELSGVAFGSAILSNGDALDEKRQDTILALKLDAEYAIVPGLNATLRGTLLRDQADHVPELLALEASDYVKAEALVGLRGFF